MSFGAEIDLFHYPHTFSPVKPAPWFGALPGNFAASPTKTRSFTRRAGGITVHDPGWFQTFYQNNLQFKSCRTTPTVQQGCEPPCPPCWPVPAPLTLLLRAAARRWRLIGMYGDRRGQQGLTAQQDKITCQQEARGQFNCPAYCHDDDHFNSEPSELPSPSSIQPNWSVKVCPISSGPVTNLIWAPFCGSGG